MENNTASTVANFTVADFTVHTSRNLITRGGEETAITPKMLAVLTELARHQGKTLSKAHLILAVWGTPHTSDMVLSRAISDLRKVFNDSARQQDYIETVTKQGYRLKQAVSWQQAAVKVTVAVKPAIIPEPQITSVIPSGSKNNDEQTGLIKLLPRLSLLVLVSLFLGIWLWPKETGPDTRINTQNKLTEPAVTYLTRNNNHERYLRFSVDGKMLAYSVSSGAQSGGKIHLHSLSDNKVVILGATQKNDDITAVSYDVAPAFSPDGKEIAYKHFTKVGCLIRVYHLLDGSERELAPCPHAKTQALDWSPDGTQLVTTVFNQIKKIEGLALVDARSGTINILPAPLHAASGYLWPRFAPDGNAIAVVYYQPNSHLWTLGLVDSNSGIFSEIMATGEEVSQVLWNESGDALYYLLVNSSDDGIWQIDLTTKTSTLIARSKSNSLDFDEMSKRFAGIARERKMNIWQSFQDPQGKRIAVPLFKNLSQTSYPSLSPDNKKLAFVSTTSEIDSLWSRSLSDNYNRLLFQAKEKEKLSEPTWSPDGKQLLITVLSQDASRMIQFDLELGNAKRFVSDNNVKMGKWSQDATMMYWYEEIDDTWQVVAKDLRSKQRKILLSHPVARFEIPDKANLHYQKIGTVEVHSRILASTAVTTPVDKMLLALKGSYEWDAHKDAIYYMSADSGGSRQMLFKMDLLTGLSTQLYAIDPILAEDEGQHLSVSDDGGMAFYTKLDQYHTDVVLMSPDN